MELNPMQGITKLYNELITLAICIYPQQSNHQNHKRKPGWNKYVREAQAEYVQVETLWQLSGCNPHGPLAERLERARAKRSLALNKMRQNIAKSIAEAMATDYSASTHFDRSRCWEPVRATIKGKTTICSPIIEGNRKTSDILEFWKTHYSEKLKATEGSLPSTPDSKEFTKLANTESEKVIVTGENVMQALRDMNYGCAYYDYAGPHMLERCNEGFSRLFATALTKLFNANVDEQKRFLSNSNNFLISYIKPIPKATDMNPTLAKSYRPISVSHLSLIHL